MSSGNADAVEAFYSLQAGSIFIGTDEKEYWTDSAHHNADVRPFFDGSFGEIRWHAGDAHALAEGGAGWTVDRPTLLFDGEEYRLRLKLIWHRENGAWKVVHSHASVGSPNPE